MTSDQDEILAHGSDAKFQQEVDAFRREAAPGLGKLNRDVCASQYQHAKQRYADFIKYYYYRRAIQERKVREGHLPPQVEREVVERAETAMNDYDACVEALDGLRAELERSGVLPILDPRMPALCKAARGSSEYERILNEYRQMGLQQPEIDLYINRMLRSGFNPFGVDSSAKTFRESIDFARSTGRQLRKNLAEIQQYGLPHIEGGCSGSAGVGVGSLGGAIIVGFFITISF